MDEAPPTQKTLGPFSMVYAPTAVVPESLISNWNTACEEAQKALTDIDNFSRLNVTEEATGRYQERLDTCQGALTAASRGNDPRILSQVFSTFEEDIGWIPYCVNAGEARTACVELCELTAEKSQRLFALSYAVMCASLGETLATDQMNDPKQIEKGWEAVQNTYGQ